MEALRDYECVSCGFTEEKRGLPSWGWRCPKCGAVMLYIMTLPRPQAATDSMWPMMHPNFGHRPVEVKSWGHFNQLLKRHGKSNPLMD